MCGSAYRGESEKSSYIRLMHINVRWNRGERASREVSAQIYEQKVVHLDAVQQGGSSKRLERLG